MPADLHVHTSFSDGEDSPEEVVDKAAKKGLKTIAITDHDVVDGVKPAQVRGIERKVEVIPGIEFSTETADAEVHILGYYIDPDNPGLKTILKKLQDSRKERIFRIVDKLKKEGLEMEPDDVFRLAAGESVGRPHVARALIKKKAVRTIREAFDRYLGWGRPAYEPHYKLSPFDAVKLALEAGGVPVYAHPAVSNCDNIIPQLIMSGLRGIEVYYPGHSQKVVAHYLTLAKKNNLLVTGGSDYHGESGNREGTLGEVTVPDRLVKKLSEARGKPE